MASLRNNTEAEAAYLDAARASILDVGWRRATLTDVARRAGVSRMTIYRTWSDMPTLLGDLMTREWSHVVSEHVRTDGPAIRFTSHRFNSASSRATHPVLTTQAVAEPP